MTTVLVVDHAHSEVCGIHDLGLRIVDNLMRHTALAVAHADVGSADQYAAALAEHGPDAVIVNYRPDLMPWWHPATITPEFAVLHNFTHDTLDARAHDLLYAGFNWVLVLDPTASSNDERVIVADRPIPAAVPAPDPPDPQGSRARIGSFGYAFPHKGFDLVAREIADTYHEATFALHMPEAHFNGAGGAPLYSQGIIEACGDAMAGPTPGAMVIEFTDDHIPERELVLRLARNDVNCLLYHPGQPDAGISSALDYLIAARRPVLLSDCTMFAHARGWAEFWPDKHLIDVLGHLNAYERRAAEWYARTDGQFALTVQHAIEAL